MDIRLRYVGERFKGARLPLDVLGDLPAFRDLVLAFARDRWHALYPERERVPRGFDQSLSFDLAAIEEGSAVPRLVWDREAAQARLPGFADELEPIVSGSFEQVVALVAEAANGNFPKALPAEHIRALNRFGSHLRGHERIEFLGTRDSVGNVVYLDIPRRKDLITKVHETYLARYEGTGILTATNAPVGQPVGRITVETPEYGSIQIPVSGDRVVSEIDGHLRQLVQFEIDVELDNQDKLRGVNELHGLTLIDEDLEAALVRCQNRMDELAKLQDNWDGEGARAIDRRAHFAAVSLLLKRPFLANGYKIFPTREGGILIEFVAKGWDLSVEIAPEGSVEFFGVEVGGNGEMDSIFAEMGDDFIRKLDEHVGRDGR